MFSLRHIAIVSIGDINVLKNFYIELFKPLKVILNDEYGSEIENITGISEIKIVTCKLICEDFIIEIIKYINPKPNIISNSNSSFTGFNHIALNVSDFLSAIKLIKENGGGLVNKNFEFRKDKKISVVYAYDPEGNILELVKENHI